MTDPDVIPTQFVVSSDWQYILVGDALDYETQGEYMLYFKASDRNNPNLVSLKELLLNLIHIHDRESSSHWSIHHHVPGVNFDNYQARTSVFTQMVNFPCSKQLDYV